MWPGCLQPLGRGTRAATAATQQQLEAQAGWQRAWRGRGWGRRAVRAGLPRLPATPRPLPPGQQLAPAAAWLSVERAWWPPPPPTPAAAAAAAAAVVVVVGVAASQVQGLVDGLGGSLERLGPVQRVPDPGQASLAAHRLHRAGHKWKLHVTGRGSKGLAQRYVGLMAPTCGCLLWSTAPGTTGAVLRCKGR